MTAIGRPTVAVLTNIGDSHLEFFKDRKGVFKEKSAIFKQLRANDCIIYNSDDGFLRSISRRALPRKKISVGIEQRALYQAKDVDFHSNGLSFCVKGHLIFLKTLSRENIYNALIAIALGRLFRLSWKKITASLRRAKFPQGRQNICQVSGFFLIDDTYNANPTSVASALMTLAIKVS